MSSRYDRRLPGISRLRLPLMLIFSFDPFFSSAVLQLLSQVSHPWVNQYMQVVGHPDLHGWDSTNPPMIGDIVAAVVHEFGRGNPGGDSSGHNQQRASWGGQKAPLPRFPPAQPPTGAFGVINPSVGNVPVGVAGVAAGDGRRLDSSGTDPSRGRETHPNAAPKRQPKHHTPIPAIPTKFDELQGLSTPQLVRLLQDDVARQALLLGMTSVVGMKDLRTQVCKGNVDTARSTITKQETARVLRDEGEQMRLALKELQTSYEGWLLTICDKQ